MYLFQFLFDSLIWLIKRDSLSHKILKIKWAITRRIAQQSDERVNVLWYGAYNINPKHLVFLATIKSDKRKNLLESDTQLNSDLRNLLIKYDYPAEAINSVYIGFESQETVDRESGGNWRIHLQ